MSIPIRIYLFWIEQPKVTVAIKVIMSLKLDKPMLFSVLFSSEYSPILFPLENVDCNRKLIIYSQFPALEKESKYKICNSNKLFHVFHTHTILA